MINFVLFWEGVLIIYLAVTRTKVADVSLLLKMGMASISILMRIHAYYMIPLTLMLNLYNVVS